MLRSWIRGYLSSFSCFPRLHVITNGSSLQKAHHLMGHVPNVTFRANSFSPLIAKAGPFYWIQWHLMWADNFTVAPYILFFDVDAIPVLPLRCHHLFDEEDRVRLFAFRYHDKNGGTAAGTHWVRPDSGVFLQAQRRGETFARHFTPAMVDLDFMTFWPIVALRKALPEMRRLVTAAMNATHFDAALLTLRDGSHADLLAKTSMVLFPERVRVRLCPDIVNRSAGEVEGERAALEDHALGRALSRAEDRDADRAADRVGHRVGHRTEGRADARPGSEPSQHAFGAQHAFGSSCYEQVNAVEHVKHPLQSLHSPSMGVRFKSASSAATYAHELINASLDWQHGVGDIPYRLFAYKHTALRFKARHNRTDALDRWLYQDEWPGRVCGARRAGSDGAPAPTAGSASATTGVSSPTAGALHRDGLHGKHAVVADVGVSVGEGRQGKR